MTPLVRRIWKCITSKPYVVVVEKREIESRKTSVNLIDMDYTVGVDRDRHNICQYYNYFSTDRALILFASVVRLLFVPSAVYFIYCLDF